VQADLHQVGSDAPEDSQFHLASQNELLCLVSFLFKLSASVHLIEGVELAFQTRCFLNQEASHHVLFISEGLVVVVPVGVTLLQVVLLVVLALLGSDQSLRILRFFVMVRLFEVLRLGHLGGSLALLKFTSPDSGAVGVALIGLLVTISHIPQVFVSEDFSFGVLLDLAALALLPVSSFSSAAMLISRRGGIPTHGVFIGPNHALSVHGLLTSLLEGGSFDGDFLLGYYLSV